MRREIKAIKFGGLRSILFNHFSNPLSHPPDAFVLTQCTPQNTRKRFGHWYRNVSSKAVRKRSRTTMLAQSYGSLSTPSR